MQFPESIDLYVKDSKWSLKKLKSLKTKEKSSWVILKVVAVAYGSGRLRGLFITKLSRNSNGISQRWS